MHIRKEFMIMIVTLCQIYCNVGIRSYEEIYGREIGDGMRIKANGPIFPIREFISEKLNLMFAMRFLSPGVDVNYSVSVIDDENNKENVKITATRDRNMDMAYINSFTKEKNEEKEKTTTYLEDYHQTVIEMFSSSTGFLSIHTSRNDSFIRFLQFEHVSKHKIDILACLFLLAEGVDIPLKIEGDKINPKLVLKEIVAKPIEQENKTENLNVSKPETKNESKKRKLKEGKTGDRKDGKEGEEEKNIFSLSMKYKRNKKNAKSVSQKRAIDVINFFINNKTNPDIREGGKYAEPTTYEEFKTGKFLNNARWLIQYYIFKYLDSEEKIIDFAKTVYSMLKACIAAKKDEKSDKSNEEVKYLESIVNKCFVKSSDANTSNAKHRIDILTTIYKESPLVNIFPFSGSIDVAEYKAISSYNRKEDSFDNSNMYSNCAEAGLLSLFCCLAYDAQTKEYNIDHMGNVSPDLKSFFHTYNKPLEADTYEMHNEWSKVVAGLENANIRYLKENRNELAPGIINMLYVIAEITGRYSKEEESLKELSTLLEKDDENQSKLFQKVKLYTEKLILSLSKTYNEEENSELARREVKIEILKMSKCLNSKKKMELFGEVVITYRYLKLEGGIILKHTIKHVQTISFPSNTDILADEKKEITNKKRRLENEPEKTLTDFLLMHCVEKVLGEEKDTSDYSKENINLSGENNYSYPIEKLFLYNTFKTAEDKMFIIYNVRECLLGYPLKETDPWARFLSNMIGSLPLNNYNIVYYVFFNPMYRGELYKSFYTKVNISPLTVDKHINLDSSCRYYVNYIKNSNSLSGHLEILKRYLVVEEHTNCFFTVIIRTFETHTIIKLFSILTHDGESIDSLLEIEAFLNGIDRKLPEYKTVVTANDMWLVWLKLSFVSDKFNKITSKLYDKIVVSEGFITRKGIKYECTDENINRAVSEFKKAYFCQKVKLHVLSLIENNPEYAKKLSYLLEKYVVFLKNRQISN